MKHPFRQKKIRGLLIREFSKDVSSEELVWHRDKSDRLVKVRSGLGWKLQLENCLPTDLKVGEEYFIPAKTYHRVIKGQSSLVVEINEKPMKNTRQVLREYVRKILSEQPGLPPGSPSEVPSEFKKGEWELLQPGDPRMESAQEDLYSMVVDTYSSIGGHVKITSPESLSRYKYWAVADVDDDPDIDVAIFGKPDIGGAKMGGAANDGSSVAAAAYKNKSAELRSGGSIGGVGNWWGEVSGKPAYAMIKRGAQAIEDEAKVAQLLAGDDYEFHGEHPDPNAPALFKSVKGWYTKKFGNSAHTKKILGSPQ